MKSLPDRYLDATETAKEHAQRVVESLPRMETRLTPALEREQVQALYDRHIKPVLQAGDYDEARRRVAMMAPLGTNPDAELRKLNKRFGGW